MVNKSVPKKTFMKREMKLILRLQPKEEKMQKVPRDPLKIFSFGNVGLFGFS